MVPATLALILLVMTMMLTAMALMSVAVTGAFLIGLLLATWGAYTVSLLRRNPDELATTENHPSWTHMYLMLMCAQVGFALAYVL